MKVWHELRVRERTGPDCWVKKSKFYEVEKPKDAVAIYEKDCHIEHTIMWCEKDRRHSADRLSAEADRLFADIQREQRVTAKKGNVFKEFLMLGDELLGELKDKNNRRFNGKR